MLGVAYWTTHRIHYDEAWARQEGYRGVVITGVLMYGWIERTLIAWAGSPERIHRFQFRHIGLACVGDTLQISLTANEVHPGSDHGEVHVGISIMKEPDGERILEGTAVLRLPTTIHEGRPVADTGGPNPPEQEFATPTTSASRLPGKVAGSGTTPA